MAASMNATDEGGFSGINVTPLVDITLVLLIIFMVTAKLITSNTMAMDLPKAAATNEQQVVFAVTVAPDGTTTVDATKVDTDEALLASARRARGRQPDLRAVIHADGSVPHRRVVRVMDLLKQAGIGKIAFGVDKVAAEPAAAGK